MKIEHPESTRAKRMPAHGSASDAGLLRVKTMLASEIVKRLDRDDLTAKEAHAKTGIAAADFSRIRNSDLGRFTVDRLLSIINRLGAHVEVRVHDKLPRARAQAAPTQP